MDWGNTQEYMDLIMGFPDLVQVTDLVGIVLLLPSTPMFEIRHFFWYAKTLIS